MKFELSLFPPVFSRSSFLFFSFCVFMFSCFPVSLFFCFPVFLFPCFFCFLGFSLVTVMMVAWVTNWSERERGTDILPFCLYCCHCHCILVTVIVIVIVIVVVCRCFWCRYHGSSGDQLVGEREEEIEETSEASLVESNRCRGASLSDNNMNKKTQIQKSRNTNLKMKLKF